MPYPCPSVVLSMAREVSGYEEFTDVESEAEKLNVLGIGDKISCVLSNKSIRLLVQIPIGFELPEYNGEKRPSMTWYETSGEVDGFMYCILWTPLENIGFVTSDLVDVSLISGLDHQHHKSGCKRRDVFASTILRSIHDICCDQNIGICPLDVYKEFKLTNIEFCFDQVELERVIKVFTASNCHRY